jgi:hypothetical protein
MFFTYKNPDVYIKKNIIQKTFEINQRIKLKDSQLINSLKNENVFSIQNIKEIKEIKEITNVYQSKYNNNTVKSSGFGDFIRGCYFLLEFCEKYNYKAKIIFNNCISKFLLSSNNNKKNKKILSKIIPLSSNNYISCNIKNKFSDTDNIILYPNLNPKMITIFKDHISKKEVYDNNCFIYCTAYPLDENVSEKSKEYIRTILKPNDTLLNSVQECLNQLELECNNYSVFHIRSGDKYLKDNNKSIQFPKIYIEKLKTNIQIFMEKNEKYLLIADNNEIKILLHRYFPDIKILLNKITHLGEGVLLEEEKVKNTLIDFYILSFSKKIFSFSCYEHGSGFSYWCAKTYNIPHIAKLIM